MPTLLTVWTVPTAVWVALGAFVLLNLLFGVFAIVATANIVFHRTMVRRDPKMWSRECSDPNPEQVAMYESGLRWAEEHRGARKDLHIVNEGMNLYAEYYDLGSDRAVIVIPGRTEGLRYGYYFAPPYANHGYNVLVIDQRAHGESDGRYNCIGFDEHRDLLCWAELLRSEFGIRSILLHGICIGSACALYALTSEAAPDCFEGLVAEGMYPNFYESYMYHMKELKKPTFIMPLVDFWMKHYTGHSMRPGPLDRIDRYEKPFLMLHGTADLYSLPARAQELYEKAGTAPEEKRLVWFEGGRHSRLRITDTARYDGAIEAFLTEVVDPIRAPERTK